MNLLILLFALSAQPPSLCEVFSDKSFWLSRKVNKICALTPHVILEAERNNVPPMLLLSLITVESNWKTTAVSSAGACGLTQVIPKYTGKITKKYTCDQLKNPKASITAGAKILRWWIDYHKDKITQKQKNKMSPEAIEDYSLVRGLCGYNAGFRCHGAKPNRAGIRYAKKILTLEQRIKNLYNVLKVERLQIPSSHK